MEACAVSLTIRTNSTEVFPKDRLIGDSHALSPGITRDWLVGTMHIASVLVQKCSLSEQAAGLWYAFISGQWLGIFWILPLSLMLSDSRRSFFMYLATFGFIQKIA